MLVSSGANFLFVQVGAASPGLVQISRCVVRYILEPPTRPVACGFVDPAPNTYPTRTERVQPRWVSDEAEAEIKTMSF